MTTKREVKRRRKADLVNLTQAAAFTLLIFGGCAQSQPATPPLQPNGGSAPRFSEEQRRLAQKRALQRLKEAVVLFAYGSKGSEQEIGARALLGLSETVSAIAPTSAPRLREVAERLKESPTTSLSHSMLIKEGLTIAQEALVMAEVPEGRRELYRRALQNMMADTRAVAAVAPLHEQHEALAQALRSATNAMFVALSQEVPFEGSEPVEPARLPSTDYSSELEQARNTVSKAGTARWTDGRAEVADALDSLADLLAAAGDGSQSEAIDELGFQARRLRETKAGWGQGTWIRAGLRAALDGLEVMQGGRVTARLRAARQAVDGISERSTLALQRFTVQDALRATVDAFDSSIIESCAPK